MPPDEPTETFSRQGGAFNTTHWSIVVQAGDSQSLEAAPALERLCRTYWYPLYTFVRRKGHSEEDAKDLTQAFFERLLEKNSIREADASRGKFRTFLLCAFSFFLANEWDKSQRQKRGGGAIIASFDEMSEHEISVGGALDSPEKAFDRRWAEKVLEIVLGRLRAEFERAGNGERFERLKAFLTGGDGNNSYAGIAHALGITEVSVRSSVSRLRQRFRELMRNEIAQTVSRPEDVDEEIRYLFETLAS